MRTKRFNSRQITWGTGLFCATLVLSATWRTWSQSLTANGANRVDIVPGVLTNDELLREYDVVHFDIKLVNGTAEAVELTALKGSCGCITFAGSGVEPIKLPVTIAAGETLPLRVVIKTGGSVGVQRYQVLARFQCGEEQVDRLADVKIKVRAGIRIDKGHLQFDGATTSFTDPQEILVYDSYPDRGVTIGSITTSNPELFEVVADEMGAGKKGVGAFEGLTLRHRIHISLTEKGRSVRRGTTSSLVIHAASSQHPPVYATLRIRPSKASVRFVPEEVVLVANRGLGAPNGEVSRIIYCYCDKALGEVRLINSLPGVDCKVTSTDNRNTWKIEVAADVRRLMRSGKKYELQFSIKPDVVISLPVRVISER